MDAIQKFETTILNWVREAGLEAVEGLEFRTDFAYNITKKKICIGTYTYPDVHEWFIEFLDDHGFMFEDVPEKILCFFHELGHAQTIYSLPDNDILGSYEFKVALSQIEGDTEDFDKKVMFCYWATPDEYAANEWLINYSSSHPNEFLAFCSLFTKAWNELCNSIDEIPLTTDKVNYI